MDFFFSLGVFMAGLGALMAGVGVFIVMVAKAEDIKKKG